MSSQLMANLVVQLDQMNVETLEVKDYVDYSDAGGGARGSGPTAVYHRRKVKKKAEGLTH